MTEPGFKEDTEQEITWEQLGEVRQVCAADVQEMEGDEEQQHHQQQALNQVDNFAISFCPLVIIFQGFNI